jgi:diguanylate cyclase (GGDEF)-like protein/PAS domain S-box-containing protein
MLGWNEEEVLGKPLPTVPDDGWEEFWALQDQVMQGASLTGVETRRRKKDGSWIDLSISTAPIYDYAEHVAGAMAVYVDITDQKRTEEALIYQAFHDALTDLPNRTLLNDRLQQAIRSADRDGTSVALFLMDLDRFKEVNDTLGHHYGDLLLQKVAMRLRDGIRESDTIARLGGDEFAILLPQVDEEGAVLVARKILDLLDQPFVVQGHRFDVGASIGITVFPEHGDNAATLLRRADIAMYVAKRGQRGCVIFSFEQEP